MGAQPRFNPLPTNPHAAQKRKSFRRFAVVIGIVFLLLGTTYGVWWNRSTAARDAEIAKILEAGEPVWFVNLRPKALNPAVDGTPLLLQAFDAIESIPDDLRNDLDALRRPFEDVPLATDERDDLEWDEGDGDDLNPIGPGLDDREPGNPPVDSEENIDVQRDDEPQLEDEMLAGDPLAESAADDAEQPPGKARPLPFAAREEKVVKLLRPYVANNREVYRLLAKALEKGHFNSTSITMVGFQRFWNIKSVIRFRVSARYCKPAGDARFTAATTKLPLRRHCNT